ncbi:MAG: hypothetical protein WED11_01750, partial [Natronospirillum sp.]
YTDLCHEEFRILVTTVRNLTHRFEKLLARSTLACNAPQILTLVSFLLTGTLIVYLTGGSGFAYPYLLLPVSSGDPSC